MSKLGGGVAADTRQRLRYNMCHNQALATASLLQSRQGPTPANSPAAAPDHTNIKESLIVSARRPPKNIQE